MANSVFSFCATAAKSKGTLALIYTLTSHCYAHTGAACQWRRCTQANGINCSYLLQSYLELLFLNGHKHSDSYSQMIWVQNHHVKEVRARETRVGVCTSLQMWLDSIYRNRRGWQAVQLEEGRTQGHNCTTWIKHCSTCLLISSSLPAKGVLHSGHTWPPSSGFLLFIFPIRAANQSQSQEETQRHTILVAVQGSSLTFSICGNDLKKMS